MKRTLVALLTLAFAGLAWSADDDHGHVIVSPDKLQWKANPNLPPGALAAVMFGDPTKSGPYVLRVKLPDGYKVPPHWHPTDENVTILQGTMMIGTGEKFDVAKAKEVSAGSFMRMPKEMRHFAQFKGESVIQVHGIGPFEINYVNSADDPRKK